VVHVVDLRASVLDASNLLEEAALDRYVFVRDAYLQRRQSKVYDGEVPSSKYEDDIGPTADAISSPKQNEAGAELAPEPVVKLEQNGGSAIPPAKDNK
jgi:phospholipid-binding lipoprotein MlaA